MIEIWWIIGLFLTVLGLTGMAILAYIAEVYGVRCRRRWRVCWYVCSFILIVGVGIIFSVFRHGSIWG